MAILARNALCLMKVESASGAEQAPDVADDVVIVEDLALSPDIGYGPRPTASASHLDSLSVRTTRRASMSISVRLRGSGTAANAPRWGRLLQAAGFKETAGTTVKYTPEPAEAKTLTVHVYVGGQLHKLIGCGFSDATISQDGGWKLTGTLIGKYLGVSEAAQPAAGDIVDDSGKFLSGLGIGFTYASKTPVLRALSLSLAPSIIERENLNDSTGYASFLAQSFAPTFSMSVEDEPFATVDWRTLATAELPASAEEMEFQVGAAAGSIIAVKAPSCRLLNWSEGAEGGLRLLEFEGQLADSAPGKHDWIEIETK